MEYKTLGIIAIIVFATTSAFMADGDDVIVETVDEYEYADYETDDFDEDEFLDEDDIEYVTSADVATESDTEAENPEPESTTVAPRNLAIRMTCAQINEKVAELREDVKSYPELKSDLEYMVGRQRTQCASSIGRRPVRNYDNVNPVKVIDVPALEPVAEVEAEPAPEPEKTPEEIAAEEEAKNAKIIENLSKGLCGDGTAPNTFGCCTGEVFKQIASMTFACCPRSGGQCLEPIK